MTKISYFFAGLIILISFGFVDLLQGQEVKLTSGPIADAALKSEIIAADNALFDAAFNTCDLATLSKMFTKDVSFVHDKWGQIAKNKKELLKVFKNSCERQAKGIDFKARRELLTQSVEIHALNNFGALEIGTHRFFAINKDKSEKETETGKFYIVWKKEDGIWKMAQTVSFAHTLAN